MTGVIYLRTSPTGKFYVGQTINSIKRNSCWLTSNKYSGTDSTIDRARAKYGCHTFDYKVLVTLDHTDKIELIKLLNELEIEYIKIYKSHISTGKGYNITTGGNNRYGELKSEHKLKISKSLKGKIPKNLTNIQQSEVTKQANRDRGKRVIVTSIDNSFTKEYSSTNAACIELELDRGQASKVLNKKAKSTKGYRIDLKDSTNKILSNA